MIAKAAAKEPPARRLPARFAAVGFLTFAALLLRAGLAIAHPMGNFSVNRWTRLTPRSGGVDVVHLVDFAEIPTQTELASAGLLGRTGLPSAAETARLKETIAKRVVAGLRLEAGGAAVPLVLRYTAFEFAPGTADLPTIRLRLELRAELLAAPGKPAAETTVRFTDGNFEGRPGWKEVIAEAGPGAVIVRSSVPTQDRSNALRDYPADPAVIPPETTVAELVVSFPGR